MPLRANDHCDASPPLYCIHPSGGDVGVYRKLARNLRSHCQVTGIRPPSESEGGSSMSSFEEIAERYSRLIAFDCPHGPVCLLGFSLGGFIATQIAGRLRQQQRQVAFLGLVDSDLRWANNPSLAKRELILRLTQISRQLRNIGLLPEFPAEKIWSDVQEIVESCVNSSCISASRVISELAARGHATRFNIENKLVQIVDSFATHCRLLSQFVAPAIHCPVHLWWPTDPPVEEGVRLAEWKLHARNSIQEKSLTGSHYEIMRMPTVRTLASQIDDLMTTS